MDYPVRTSAQLGQLLKGLRQERRLTQAQVAAQMGTLQGKISELEANPGRVGVDRLLRLLGLLGMELVLRERGKGERRRGAKRPLW
jgi:HTH-type transcriptional regulator/antitoxin HipB